MSEITIPDISGIVEGCQMRLVRADAPIALMGNGEVIIAPPKAAWAARINLRQRLASDARAWRAAAAQLSKLSNTFKLTPPGYSRGVSYAGIYCRVNGSSQLGTSLTVTTDLGGYKLDGASDYLDGNALTGITDTKTFTMFLHFRLQNAASADEVLYDGFGGVIRVTRGSTGVLTILAENSAGTTILALQTSTTAVSAAGRYTVLARVDLATPGSSQIYINGVDVAITVVTFTNDTIDFTVAEYAIGAIANGGAAKMTGDFYTVWFDERLAIDFDTAANRALFIDSNNNQVDLGTDGGTPLVGISGAPSAPHLFLAYDAGSDWKTNKGTATGTFTVNGAAAVPTTRLRTASTAVAVAGDYIEVNGEFKVLTADVTTDTNGEATMSFEPALRSSPADNLEIEMDSPRITMRFVQPIAEWDIRAPQSFMFSLDAVEPLGI